MAPLPFGDHSFDVGSLACVHCDLTVREVHIHGVLPCARRWPLDVVIAPAPMRGRIRVYVPSVPEPDPLPDGVWERGGQLFYTCLSCQCAVPLHCDLDEFDPDTAYCGGSPRCLP